MSRAVTASLIAGLLLVACDSGPEIPEGWQEAETGPVTFAHPEDWNEGSAEGGAELQIEGPESGTGIQVFVSDEEGDSAARATALVAELRTTLEGFELAEQTETEVDNAESATLVEYSFDGEGGSVHSWDIVAEGTEGDQIIFRVAGGEDDLDGDTAQQVLDSLSLQ
jgi:nucleotide-binding universal stress UspA family protein